MKKKSGFTLAEILVTLGIIGIVAALTTPSLVSSYQKSKVGPTLRKFINTIETANQHIMGDDNVDTLSGSISTDKEYIEKLAKYLKGSPERMENGSLATISQIADYYGSIGHSNAKPIFTFATGDAFAVSYFEVTEESKQKARDSYKGAVGTIYYDINGFGNKPDRLAKDIFIFSLDNNGTVLPYGGKQYKNAYNTSLYYWENPNYLCNESNVKKGYTCAGSIADNGWKVIYE